MYFKEGCQRIWHGKKRNTVLIDGQIKHNKLRASKKTKSKNRMKSIITIVIVFASISSALAQKTNLSKMSEKSRTSYLVKLAREVSDNFGPGWIQGNIITSVSPLQEYDGEGDTRDCMKPHMGRKFYEITFIYDETTRKEVGWWCASCVKIWEDSGEPIDVIYGNNYGKNFFSFPYRTWVRAGIEQEEQVQFEKACLPEWIKDEANKHH